MLPALFLKLSLSDNKFKVDEVRKGTAEAVKMYRFPGEKKTREMRFLGSQNDFPSKVRVEPYNFIDKILNFIVN